jgi:dynein heavy chain, axonemal
LCNAHNKSTTQPVHVVRMWIHENKRVFGDRLIDNTDRDWLDELLLKESETTFQFTKKEIFNAERLIFGDYM